jgi:hypothetical protein
MAWPPRIKDKGGIRDTAPVHDAPGLGDPRVVLGPLEMQPDIAHRR